MLLMYSSEYWESNNFGEILCWCILSFLLGCICIFGINKIFCNTDNLADYDKIQKLILWERQARVRHLTDELANCYFSDDIIDKFLEKNNFL